jgi:uncharacterized membrane protein
MLGIRGGLQDLFERLGLIILGFALVILGIHLLSSGGSSKGTNVTVNEPSSKRNTSSRSSGEVETASKASKGVGASEAVEAAAVA